MVKQYLVAVLVFSLTLGASASAQPAAAAAEPVDAAKIIAAADRQLTDAVKRGFGGAVISPDFDGVEALAEDRAALWSRVGGAEFLSDAEKRAMLGV